MSYARTQSTKNKINAKEEEWKKLKSGKSGKIVGQVISYVALGGAIVYVIISAANKKAAGN